MAANVPPHKHRAALQSLPLSAFPSWTLDAACHPCRRTVAVPTARLPQDQRMGDVVAQLRCRECGAAPTVVMARFAERVVPMLGGAYG